MNFTILAAFFDLRKFKIKNYKMRKSKIRVNKAKARRQKRKSDRLSMSTGKKEASASRPRSLRVKTNISERQSMSSIQGVSGLGLSLISDTDSSPGKTFKKKLNELKLGIDDFIKKKEAQESSSEDSGNFFKMKNTS